VACCEDMPKLVGEKLSSMLLFPTPEGAAGVPMSALRGVAGTEEGLWPPNPRAPFSVEI